MVKPEVKRAPSDRDGIQPTIRRSPYEIHRSYRQPSRLYAVPIDQTHVLPLSTVRQEGQTETGDDTTHAARRGASSPLLDSGGSGRVAGPMCMLQVFPGAHPRRALSRTVFLGSAQHRGHCPDARSHALWVGDESVADQMPC